MEINKLGESVNLDLKCSVYLYGAGLWPWIGRSEVSIQTTPVFVYFSLMDVLGCVS